MIRKMLLTAAVVVLAAPVVAQSFHRHEVSVSYGVSPVTTWVDTYGNILSDIFTGEQSDIDGWGAVTVGYNFRLTSGLSLGAQVAYASTRSEFRRSGATLDNRYWTVMPNLKWNWINLKVVSLYSRVGLGVAFCKSSGSNVSDTSSLFAFQVSPIGVEVGGRLAAYAEAGIGNSGSLVVGARYRF